jgi:hypothetical protein
MASWRSRAFPGWIGVGRRALLLGGVLRLAAPAPPVAVVLRLTGLDMHFEILGTVQAAISASARLGGPDASPRGHAPAGQLSTRPAGCAGPLRRLLAPARIVPLSADGPGRAVFKR